jgi:nitrate reductase gamma subunit
MTFSLATIMLLVLAVLTGVRFAGACYFFGAIMPYFVFFSFLGGYIYRMFVWARSPVPFRITTTCGQQKSLSWIKSPAGANPWNTFGVVKRMLFEVLLFRSLLRNTTTELKEGSRLVCWTAKWLWLAGLAFHWSLLIIIARHLRFFVDPVPFFVKVLGNIDGAFELGFPALYLTDFALLIALIYLMTRRIAVPALRYVSLPADYFPLVLLLGIAFTGVLMRACAPFRVDLIAVKELALGLATFHPVIPQGVGSIFYVHFFLVSMLLAYFPFSKLMHLGGLFLSPTHNLANTSRRKRHVNPWDYPVTVHSYKKYEEEFREKMKRAGIPVEKA